MRNEKHFWLRELHWLAQRSRFFLGRGQRFLCLLQVGEAKLLAGSSLREELQRIDDANGLSRCDEAGEAGRMSDLLHSESC